MTDNRTVPRRYRAAWVALGVVLVATFAVWGARIEGALHSGTEAAVSSPVPGATGQAFIVTVSSADAVPLPANICVELAPQSKLLTVETVTGQVVTTIHC
jgi:hypothetical protein